MELEGKVWDKHKIAGKNIHYNVITVFDISEVADLDTF